MSAIKSRMESRVIFDFTDQALTKKSIKNILKKIEVREIDSDKDLSEVIFIENSILVGSYEIHLSFSFVSTEDRRYLKEYGRFKVFISEKLSRKNRNIDLKKDGRFKNHSWVKKNAEYKLGINDLTEIIELCNKLDRLKAFL